MGEIIGIDFGTSTSMLAQPSVRGGRVVPIGRTEKWVPSIAGLSNGSWALGEDASNFAEPAIIRSVKRTITMGEKVVWSRDAGRTTLVAADDVIRDLLAEIMQRAAETGISFSDDDTSVRLGCPAMWTGEQRRRLINLANEVGLPVHDATLVDEPIAAGVAWVNERIARGDRINGKVLVFDMGGGTLDLAILDVHATPDLGGRVDIAVQAAQGNEVAGDMLDLALLTTLTSRLRSAGFDLDHHEAAAELRGWLLKATREAKVELSAIEETIVSVPHADFEIPTVVLTREDVTAAITPLMDEAINAVWSVARAALMTQVAGSRNSRTLTVSQVKQISSNDLASEIKHVLLAGGMTRVPAVSQFLGERFGHNKIHTVSTPEELIAAGLGSDTTYESLNLHRPGFDFVLEWEADGVRQECRLYSAYQPFYDTFQVLQTESVKYTRRISAEDQLPRTGEGNITARSVSGEIITLTIDGVPSEGITYRFGQHADPVFTIEPNGQIYVRDSLGHQTRWFVSRWPVIKGRGAETIHVTRDKPASITKRWWYDESGD